MRCPQESLPKRAGNWADLKAGYRLLDNPGVAPAAIGASHREWTRQRIASLPRVLCVQDDTDLQAARVPGGHEVIHSTLAVDADGRIQGILDQRWFERVQASPGETRRQRQQRWRESCVWSEAVKAVGVPPPGQQWIHIADRAADDLSFLQACRQVGVDFVVRAKHDRRLQGGPAKLWEQLRQVSPAGELEVRIGVQRRGPKVTRQGRRARLELRFLPVTLSPPWNHPGSGEPQPMWAVYLRELEDHGKETVDWMLLTSEPVESFDDALRIVQWYRCRWVIEEWHRALKEGCRLESAQLAGVENLRRLSAICSVVAVRLLEVRDLAEANDEQADRPEALQATASPLWIEMVARLGGRSPQTLTPRQFWHTIARQGGWLGRKGDGRPGWKVVWRGWYDLCRMIRGAELLLGSSLSPRCG
ncbi:MAG: IS4 family transposase [Planctomycetota bacterium]